MCGENDPLIHVYYFELDGMRGPCESTIKGLLDNVETECSEFAEHDGEPRTIKITMGRMRQSAYDKLPEFQGY